MFKLIVELVHKFSYTILILCIFLFSSSSFLFAQESCAIDFSNLEYFVFSGGDLYLDELDSNLYVIKSNLSSHPLRIILSTQTSIYEGCYNQNDLGMRVSGTISLPSNFEIETVSEGNYLVSWIFDIQEDLVFQNEYQSFQFQSLSDSSMQDILTLRVDRELPEISLINVLRGSEEIDINFPVLNSQLKNDDVVSVIFRITDDVALEDIRIRNLRGAEIILNQTTQNSRDEYEFEVQVRLDTAPLEFQVIASDKFNTFEIKDFSLDFDSFEPTIDSLEIIAYEITSNLQHIIIGEITLRDDFEIVADDVTLFSRNQDSNLEINYQIISCNTDDERESNLLYTLCTFRSQPIQVESTFTTNFSIRVFDMVRNEIISNFVRTIEINNEGPEIHTFELRNPINNTNILSSLNAENSKIILEYSNDLSSLYSSSQSSNSQRVTIQRNFEPFIDISESLCEEINSRTNRHRCIWEVNPLDVAGYEEFNISIQLRDITGSANREEISIIVNDIVPNITNLRIAERGNERNSILESYENVRIEFFVKNVDELEEFETRINGSNIIFRNSPDTINFMCQYVKESELGNEGQICFSDEFELNRGFDGDRTEDLRIIVTNDAGNSDLAIKEVKIFKIFEGESIDYFDLDFVQLLTPLNRRVVKEQGMDVYHQFGLKPKNNNEEFKIISVQLLGMGVSSDSQREDVRLNFFELQNQTSQGVVLGDNRNFFLKSFMPQLMSAYEMEGETQSTVVLSIVKTDIDTVYKDENVTIVLPIEFYDMPRDLNSNIALAQKILDDINSVNENVRNGRGLLDIYMMYYNICGVYNGIKGTIQSLSQSWNAISLAFGSFIPGSQAIDTATQGAAQGESMLGNMDNIMGKICMLASCSFSQELIGGALNSVTGDMQIGDYLTGQRSFLGNMMCSP
ncbi:MAG: hypothetical protein LAT82_02320 [Nanoarchaeota archaeon]|nr:hypothetical protein [Nanoarchaeota archaeon]